ncbi:Intraflagellar Transport Protein 80-like [Manis pentadactyla]|nr:Intraflagellar Transport Protein 80-like [Manis pentadactyla]
MACEGRKVPKPSQFSNDCGGAWGTLPAKVTPGEGSYLTTKPFAPRPEVKLWRQMLWRGSSVGGKFTLTHNLQVEAQLKGCANYRSCSPDVRGPLSLAGWLLPGVKCSNNRKQLCKPEEEQHFRQTEDFSVFQES